MAMNLMTDVLKELCEIPQTANYGINKELDD